MSEVNTYPVAADVASHAHVDQDRYLEMYQRSVDDPEGFWAEQAEKFVTWFKPWDNVMDVDFHKAHIRWFDGGKLNVCYNCVDRHLESRGDQVAIIWEGDEPDVDKSNITNYSSRFASLETCSRIAVFKKGTGCPSTCP